MSNNEHNVVDDDDDYRMTPEEVAKAQQAIEPPKPRHPHINFKGNVGRYVFEDVDREAYRKANDEDYEGVKSVTCIILDVDPSRDAWGGQFTRFPEFNDWLCRSYDRATGTVNERVPAELRERMLERGHTGVCATCGMKDWGATKADKSDCGNTFSVLVLVQENNTVYRLGVKSRLGAAALNDLLHDTFLSKHLPYYARIVRLGSRNASEGNKTSHLPTLTVLQDEHGKPLRPDKKQFEVLRGLAVSRGALASPSPARPALPAPSQGRPAPPPPSKPPARSTRHVEPNPYDDIGPDDVPF